MTHLCIRLTHSREEGNSAIVPGSSTPTASESKWGNLLWRLGYPQNLRLLHLTFFLFNYLYLLVESFEFSIQAIHHSDGERFRRRGENIPGD